MCLFLFLFVFRIGFFGIIHHQAASSLPLPSICTIFVRGVGARFQEVFFSVLDKHGDLTGLGVGGWGTPRAALAG